VRGVLPFRLSLIIFHLQISLVRLMGSHKYSKRLTVLVRVRVRVSFGVRFRN